MEKQYSYRKIQIILQLLLWIGPNWRTHSSPWGPVLWHPSLPFAWCLSHSSNLYPLKVVFPQFLSLGNQLFLALLGLKVLVQCFLGQPEMTIILSFDIFLPKCLVNFGMWILNKTVVFHQNQSIIGIWFAEIQVSAKAQEMFDFLRSYWCCNT